MFYYRNLPLTAPVIHAYPITWISFFYTACTIRKCNAIARK